MTRDQAGPRTADPPDGTATTSDSPEGKVLKYRGFEGEVTEAQIATIKTGVEKLLDADTDSVIVFTARDARWLDKQVIGCERGETGNLL